MGTTRQELAAEGFTQATEGHVLVVRHDQGLYRHLSFASPHTGQPAWDVVTWPGGLTVYSTPGMDSVFTFTGVGRPGPGRPVYADLFEWFRATSVSGAPNPDLWDYGVSAGVTGEYSPGTLAAWVQAETARYEDECPGLSEMARNEFAGLNAPATEHDALVRLEEFAYPRPGENEDPGEPQGQSFWFDADDAVMEDWAPDFLHACHAVLAVISAYDQASAAAGPLSAQAARRG
jgi:hypothetical protein